jgi:hypothetical protein
MRTRRSGGDLDMVADRAAFSSRPGERRLSGPGSHFLTGISDQEAVSKKGKVAFLLCPRSTMDGTPSAGPPGRCLAGCNCAPSGVIAFCSLAQFGSDFKGTGVGRLTSALHQRLEAQNCRLIAERRANADRSSGRKKHFGRSHGEPIAPLSSVRVTSVQRPGYRPPPPTRRSGPLPQYSRIYRCRCGRDTRTR